MEPAEVLEMIARIAEIVMVPEVDTSRAPDVEQSGDRVWVLDRELSWGEAAHVAMELLRAAASAMREVRRV